jgi:hypothetical protein
MQKKKVNPAILVVGAILVIGLAVVLIFKQVTAPTETINPHPERIPPKGAAGHSGKN